jgi:hypothetical protein
VEVVVDERRRHARAAGHPRDPQLVDAARCEAVDGGAEDALTRVRAARVGVDGGHRRRGVCQSLPPRDGIL